MIASDIPLCGVRVRHISYYNFVGNNLTFSVNYGVFRRWFYSTFVHISPAVECDGLCQKLFKVTCNLCQDMIKDVQKLTPLNEVLGFESPPTSATISSGTDASIIFYLMGELCDYVPIVMTVKGLYYTTLYDGIIGKIHPITVYHPDQYDLVISQFYPHSDQCYLRLVREFPIMNHAWFREPDSYIFKHLDFSNDTRFIYHSKTTPHHKYVGFNSLYRNMDVKTYSRRIDANTSAGYFLSWEEAESICRSYGAHLLSIHSEVEMRQALEVVPAYMTVMVFFIGAKLKVCSKLF